MRTPARPSTEPRTARHARLSGARSPRAKGASRRASPGGSILLGRVVDAETALPLAGAHVAIADGLDPLARLSPTRCQRQQTDELGSFEIPRPGPAGAVVLVHHTGHLPEMLGLDCRAEDVLVRLERAGAVSGRLLTEGGLAVADARVIALSRSAMDLGEARTDGAGRFVIEPLRPGRYLVHVAEGDPRSRLVAPALVEVNRCAAEVPLVLRTGGASVTVHALDARRRPCDADALLAPGDAPPALTVAELLERGPLLAAVGHGMAQVIPLVPPGRHTLFLVRETGADEPDIRSCALDVQGEDVAVEVVLPDLGPASEL
jgi:hypothetical protein